MSALDTAIKICRYLGTGDKNITADLMISKSAIADIIARDESAELAALRARVEQAERERDASVADATRIGLDNAILRSERDSKADSLNAWAELWAHIVKRLGGDSDTLPTTANFDTLAESSTLTPRRCGTCCTEAAKAMRDAAKEVSDKFANAKRMKLPGPFGGLHDPDENGFETVSPYVGWTARSISSEINALPLPSCDGCNPLKPEAAS